MRRVEHLLRATASAEARHFWFRGFRAFVTPLVRHAIAGRPTPAAARLRMRHRRERRTARHVRPRVRLRPDRNRPADRPRGRPHASRARQRHGGPLSDRRLRPRHLVRRAVCARRRRRAHGDRGDVPAAETGRLRHRQRRGDEHAAGRSFGVRRRGPAVQPRRAAQAARGGRLRDRAPDLHQRHALRAARRVRACCSAVGGSGRSSTRSTKSWCPRRRSTRS